MLESKLIEMTWVATNIEPLLEKAVLNLGHLDQLYKEGDVKRKQYRTTRVNEAVELIYELDKGFTKKMKLDKPRKYLICPVWLPNLDYPAPPPSGTG